MVGVAGGGGAGVSADGGGAGVSAGGLPGGGAGVLSVGECYAAVLRARNPGYLFTRAVSGRLGTVVAAAGMRLGVHPVCLTLLNLVLGVGGSAAVLAGYGRGGGGPLVVGGVVLWQAAYVFDCADGKLARATGKTSVYGKSVDIFADVGVQVSVVVAVGRVMLDGGAGHGLLAVLFASLWYLNFVTVLLARGDGGVSHSLVARRSAVVSVVKLLRDYGFLVLVLGVWLVVSPGTLAVPAAVVTGVNLVLLVGYIARSAGLSVRATRKGAL